MNGKACYQKSIPRPASAGPPQKAVRRDQHRRTITPTPVTLSTSRNVTQEIDDPSPDVGTWRRSLRSPSPSSRFHLSPSPTRKNELPRTTDSFDFSRFKETLDRSLNDTTELESEYVKSLRAQIKILELDNSYLRDRGLKISQMHPSMRLEAEAMLEKLKEMQLHSDGLDLEIYRKNGDIDRLTKVNDHLVTKIKDEMDVRVREKQSLMADVMKLKGEKDAADRELAKLDGMLQDVNLDHATNLNCMRITEGKLDTLRNDLNSQFSMTETSERALYDARERLAGVVSELMRAEKKAIACEPLPENEQEIAQLRAEAADLRSRLTNASAQLETNMTERAELSDEVGRQVKENVALTQLLGHMRTDMQKITNFRQTTETQRSQETLSLQHTANHIKELEADNERMRADLAEHNTRSVSALDSIKRFEEQSSGTLRDSSLAQSRLKQLEYSCKNLSDQNRMLQREKSYLIDQVEVTQTRLKERGDEALTLDTHVSSLMQRIEELDRLTKMESSLQSQRWSELARLANDVRSFASRRPDGQVNGASLPPSGRSGKYDPKRYK